MGKKADISTSNYDLYKSGIGYVLYEKGSGTVNKVVLTQNNNTSMIYTSNTPPVSTQSFNTYKSTIINNNQLIIDSFIKYSKYGKASNVEEHLTYFLYAMQIVSTHEGTFGSINTYDAGGLSVGLIQLALTGVLFDYLKELDSSLYQRVYNYFGKGSASAYKDNNSLLGRKDTTLIDDLYNSITSSLGKELQIKYAIKYYYDDAYTSFLNNVKPVLKSKTNKPDLNTTNEGDLFVYANGFCFDCNVNNPSQFQKINQTNVNKYLSTFKELATEGHFIYYFSNSVVDLNIKARDSDWNGINKNGPFANNFQMIV